MLDSNMQWRIAIIISYVRINAMIQKQINCIDLISDCKMQWCIASPIS